jgi:hypothetical protein
VAALPFGVFVFSDPRNRSAETNLTVSKPDHPMLFGLESDQPQSPDPARGRGNKTPLDSAYQDAMRTLEAFSIAVRYFSRFPRPSVVFAKCAAGKARHASVLAARIAVAGRVRPVSTRADILDLMPGFKSDNRGGLNELVAFLLRISADEDRVLARYNTIARCTTDESIRRLFRRFVRDEESLVRSLRELLTWLGSEGHAGLVAPRLADDAAGEAAGTQGKVDA